MPTKVMRLKSWLNLLLRLSGGVVFGLLGWAIADLVPAGLLPASTVGSLVLHLVLAIGGAVIGAIILPTLLERPVNALVDYFTHASLAQLIAALVGLLIGLLIAALLALPLALLPDPFRQILPVMGAIVFGTLGVIIMNARYREIFQLLRIRLPDAEADDAGGAMHVADAVHSGPNGRGEKLLLDTSVIIDGRVADLSQTGFLRGEIVVPRFVLNELQFIADSPDGLRRARGRRGLEVLKRLQKESRSPVKIVDDDAPKARGVDEKLVVLAQQWNCPIMTNDFNLNKVASLQGVTVLNVNELANAVKSVVLPGETLAIRVIQLGKEPTQGLAYLDDGTMIVIENGAPFLDKTVDVTVTKVLQTAAGRMIFAKP